MPTAPHILNRSPFLTEGAGPGVRLRTLIMLRWIAIAGQLATLLLVHYYLGFDVALPWALGLVAASALLNSYLSLRFPSTSQVTSRQASLQFAFDLLQLAGLLYLSGGLENPFAVLILVPVTISATILSLRSTIFLIGLALACLLVLARAYLPLPWGEEPLTLTPTYLAGVWVALAIAIVFVAAYAWRVSAEARRRAQALAATQAALAREQKLSAVGSLAAAAAHELGTPLGTITLIAKELARDHGQDPAFKNDLDLLASQAERCRDILANLSQRAEAEDQHFKRMPCDALVREAGRFYETGDVEVLYTATPIDGDDRHPPVISLRPEIMHGLGNFIENALRFAKDQVHVDLSWDTQMIHLVISDDGPGFSPDILGILGEPYLTSQTAPNGKRGGMGLGIFIATTLLDRTGASVIFLNDVDGGAVVDITWPRAAIEEKGEAWEAMTR